MKEGVSLADMRDRCDLPEFARWDQYETLHPQNANYTFFASNSRSSSDRDRCASPAGVRPRVLSLILLLISLMSADWGENTTRVTQVDHASLVAMPRRRLRS